MKKIVRKLIIMAAIAVTLAGLSAVSASAKTVKLKGAAFTTSTAAADIVATPVGTGTMTVKVPKKTSGYLRFTAPATKAYSFTVSNIKAGRFCCGYFYVMTMYGTNNSYIGQEKIATQGGEATGLFVSTKKSKGGSAATRYRKSRTGTIALQAGQTVYIYFSMTRKCTLKFKIK
ncbi:MAG: hypothetical protein J6E32_07725 [Lachnospiraceae bacterium]|nr:hypothetical protein [Lachnospiraceae bacterium]